MSGLRVQARIERRILVNYRVDPDVLARVLPAGFRPQLVDGVGIAGICLIRLGRIRPRGLPGAVGITTENAAHRVAVEWDGPDGPVNGVYIPRRDTSSRLVVALGGRVFPGWHHRANFAVDEADGCYRVELASRDGEVHVAVAARSSASVMAGSAFGGLVAASHFFRCAPVGYSATPDPGQFDGVELTTDGWGLRPLVIDLIRSSFFEDSARFPLGSAVLDSAFLMEGLNTTWTPRPVLVCGRRGGRERPERQSDELASRPRRL